MRKIAANMIFSLTSAPLKNSYIVLSDDGCVIETVDTGGQILEIASLEYYNGILVPGFITNHMGGTQLSANFYWNSGIQVMVTDLQSNSYVNPELIQRINDTEGWLNSGQIVNQLMQKQSGDGVEAFQHLLEEIILKPAIALNLQHKYGSFSQGTQPGVILISPFNFKTFRLNANSFLRRLV